MSSLVRKYTVRFCAGLTFLIIGSCGIVKLSGDENSSHDKELEQILSSMTLEEKVGQTCQITLDVLLQTDAKGAVSPAKIDPDKLKEALLEYKVGSVLNVGWHTLTRDEWNTIINDINAPYVKGSIKVPVIYGIDAIHGMNYTAGGTLFPQEIGLAATWNRTLVQEAASITAYEVRASGIAWNFSPVLDLGRQPLWSRHFETLGEDPYLCAELGSSMIIGYQGTNPDSIGQNNVAACMKHFVGYSAALSGRDRTPGWIPEKYMRELYLPSFKKAVESGAQTVMINSGVVNGIPGHTNYHLLTEVLKGEFQFQGFAVSDWEDFIMLHTVHKTSETLESAYVSAFNAGVDMSMVPLSPFYKEYCKIIISAVKEGKISNERLNDAVRRILRVKKNLGLFSKTTFEPVNYPDFGSEKFRNQSLLTALESITLLKNDQGTLPLQRSKKILVAGPTSNQLNYLNGAWTHTWQGMDTAFNSRGCKTVKEAFEYYIGKENVLFAQGAELFLENGFEQTRAVNTEDYLKKLDQCDIAVLCLGELPSTEKPGDIHSLNLDAEQLRLVELAHSHGKPVVVVLLEGRPRIIRSIVDKSAAIVQCYLPGDYGAEALVKLLYGEVNFSGKLPYTYPKYDGVIEHYDHPKSVDRSKSGDFSAYDPQWDFGFGMSYSNASYGAIQIHKNEFKGDEKIQVSVQVTNTGKMQMKEIVQLYLSDDYASLVPAGKRLKRFEKVDLKPGETREVAFELTKEDLQFYDNDERILLESGEFTIAINNQKTTFYYAAK
jgi:beta-glucosidase